AIGKIQANKISFLLIQSFHKIFANIKSTHLWFEVISSHFWRWTQNARFSFKRHFSSTRKEESYVWIFFCFGNTNLFLVMICQHFSKRLCDIFFVINYFYFLKSIIIIGQRNKV